MDVVLSFMISVIASIIAHYICKWLDGDDKKLSDEHIIAKEDGN